MTNEELKEKLIGIIRQGFIDADCRKPYTNEPYPFFDSQIFCIADALIAYGLRFGENLTATFDHMALEREHELERRLAEAMKAMHIYERALYYATLNGETADEVKYNDALKRAQKDFAKNKGD